MIPYKERYPRIPRPSDYTCRNKAVQFDRWYSWLINDWIPNQPDAAELMKLFIECEFSPVSFVKALMSEPNEI